MKRYITLYIKSVTLFSFLLFVSPLHALEDLKSPSEQTLESLHSGNPLPSESQEKELRARPPGGDPIGGIDATIEDIPVYCLILALGMYMSFKTYSRYRLRKKRINRH